MAVSRVEMHCRLVHRVQAGEYGRNKESGFLLALSNLSPRIAYCVILCKAGNYYLKLEVWVGGGGLAPAHGMRIPCVRTGCLSAAVLC